MQILNYTGSSITVDSGLGYKVLTFNGHARCNITLKRKVDIDMTIIYRREYSKVEGLPYPDPNFQKLYIVSKEVAEAAQPRFDLLVAEGPEISNGVSYYKLVNV